MKIAVMLCALLSTVAFAGSKPSGSGSGSPTNTDRLNGENLNGVWQNGINLNTAQQKATGFKARNAAAHHGKLFIRGK